MQINNLMRFPSHPPKNNLFGFVQDTLESSHPDTSLMMITEVCAGVVFGQLLITDVNNSYCSNQAETIHSL